MSLLRQYTKLGWLDITDNITNTNTMSPTAPESSVKIFDSRVEN